MDINSSFGKGCGGGGGGGAARCLFGPPNPKTSKEVVDKLIAKSALSFSKKWNFNITADPINPAQTASESGSVSEKKYKWDPVYPQDENDMEKCDKYKFKGPCTTTASSVVPSKNRNRTLVCNQKTFIKVKITDYMQVKKTKLTNSSCSKMV